MRKLLRRAAEICGWRTTYHVAATYTRKGYTGFSCISMTYQVTPWLHGDNYAELIYYVETKAEQPETTPSITSITKLGP